MIAQSLSRFILTLLLFALPALGQTDLPDLPGELASSVIALVGEETCATGFILNSGEIVTNAHVSGAVCMFGHCRRLRLFRAGLGSAEPWIEIPVRRIDLIREIPSLDLAFLSVESDEDLSGVFSSSGSVAPGAEISVLGFPLCEQLTLTRGVVQTREPHGFVTDAKINKGSSGSPVFDKDLRLAGVISQSATLSGGLGGLVAGMSHDGRAISGELVFSLLHGSDRFVVQKELELATAFFESHVMTKTGIERWLAGLMFGSMVEGIVDRSVTDGDSLTAILVAGLNSLPLIPIDSGDAAKLEAEILSVALSLEGPDFFLQTRPADAEIIRELRRAGRPIEHIARVQTLLAEYAKRSYPGIYPMTFFAFLVAGLLFAFWAFTIGFVWARSGGSIFRRVLSVALVGFVLWPISFVIFVYRNRRRQGKGDSAIDSF